jgi:hypothetical protein
MKATDFVSQIVKPLISEGHEALTVQSTYRIIDPKRPILDAHQMALLRAHGVTYIVTRFAPRKQGGRKRQAHLGKVKRLLQQGWSQTAIAKDMGIAQSAVSNALKKILIEASKRGQTISLPKRGKSSFSTPKRSQG